MLISRPLLSKLPRLVRSPPILMDFFHPSGQSGAMRMFLWDETSPERDGALENDIVVHENTHGITNRMTGGGTGRCLQTTEAGGMGEGWSDAMAECVFPRSF